ncbi:MAG: helix-turn-helix transcriptional regulator [Oscillospiraceae bacterium]|nr:helix-turn-helix transcriptional regulator [Oscillospiraceae bacterium]
MQYPRIRDLREDNDRTQGETAALLFLQREVYRRYETGERETPLCIAIAIADLYNVSLDYLTGRTDNPNNPNLKEK